MKRIFCMVLVTFFIVFCAFAEEVDYASMNTDELLKMRDELENELRLRIRSDPWLIYGGDYYVGEDADAAGLSLAINDGFYTISCSETSYAVSIRLYENLEKYNSRAEGNSFNVAGENTNIVLLEEGMVLSVVNGIGIVEPIDKPPYMP